MNFKKKVLSLILCAITIVSMSMCAFAAEDGNNTVDNVTVETTTDKDTYLSGDKAVFTVKVTNNNDFDISDFAISYDIPANFEVITTDMPKTIDLLKAGESKTLTFETIVTSDSEAPFQFPTTLVIVAGVAVVVIVVAVVIVMKKKKKQASALMLVGALIAGTLASVSVPSFDANAEEVKNTDYRRVSVHDPSIVKDPETGMYYVFGTHLSFAKSEDMLSWSSFTTNVQSDYEAMLGDFWKNYGSTPKNSDLRSNLWAPDVIYNETMGKWCMYMSVNGNDWRSAIVLLTADNIEGPYEYVGGVMYSGFFDDTTLNQDRVNQSDIYKVLGEGADLSKYNSTGLCKINAIDPNVTKDDEGNYWMTYGSWSAGIFQIKIDSTTGLRDYNYTYEDKIGVSDPYLGYKIAGGDYNSGEGAYILNADGYYYLFVSIGNLETSGGYNMRVYRSESINGPFVDEAGNSPITKTWNATLGYNSNKATKSKYTSLLGIKLMGAYDMYGNGRVQVAQGHNSAFVDDDGKMYVVYHTRFAGTSEGHEVRVHQLFQTETGWITAAPYEYSKETLSTEGYTVDDVAGTYEFLVQRKNVTYSHGAAATEGASFWMNTFKTITVNSEEVTLSMRIDWKEAVGVVEESKGVVYGMEINLNADGTISGYYTGKWEITSGANVKMTVDGVEYSGVFVEQQNELSTRDKTMCFTLVGGNQCAWGVKNPELN